MLNSKLISKSFGTLMTTMMLTGLVTTLGAFIDGVIVGNYMGQESMAAFGYASPMFIFISSIAGIFANGGKALCSKYIGEEKYDKVRRNYSLSCAVAGIVGLVLMLLCIFAAQPIARLLGARGELIQPTANYVRGLGFGAIPITMMQVVTGYICLDNAENLCFLGALVMTAVNVTLDVLVAVVWHGGLLGMALATSASYLAGLLVELVYFRRRDRLLVFAKPDLSLAELGRIVKTGMPSAVSHVCYSAASVLLNMMLFASMGAMAVSAFSVQSTLDSFVSALVMGITSEVSIFAGIFYGERNRSSLKLTFLTACKYGTILGFVMGAVIFIAAPWLAGLILKADAETLALATTSLRYLSLSLPSQILTLIPVYYYLSIERVSLSVVLCVLRSFLLIVIPSAILQKLMGVNGIWMGLLLSCFLVYPTMLPLLRRNEGKTRLERIMALKRDFEPADQKVFEASITDDMDQVMQTVERMRAFCLEAGIDANRARRICLSIEEIVGNVVQHGFKRKGGHFIDIRFLASGERCCLSVRDNGVKFNPLSYQNRETQYGIRLIRGITREMRYCYAAGMNNLSIDI